MEISFIEPDSFIAGDSVSWKRRLVDYPAPTWVLSYVLINSTQKITITASNDGTDHLIDITAATSAAYVSGYYDFYASVTDGVDRYTIATGRIQVKPNLAVQTTFDNRSHARKMLEAIDALLESRASSDQLDLLDMSIDTRNIKRDPGKLLALRDRYQQIVNLEDNANKIKKGLFGVSRKIQVRLVNR